MENVQYCHEIFSHYAIMLAFGKPSIDIQRHSKIMKHSPKMLEIFRETCTSLEIFSEIFGDVRRRDDGSWCMIKGSGLMVVPLHSTRASSEHDSGFMVKGVRFMIY